MRDNILGMTYSLIKKIKDFQQLSVEKILYVLWFKKMLLINPYINKAKNKKIYYISI